MAWARCDRPTSTVSFVEKQDGGTRHHVGESRGRPKFSALTCSHERARNDDFEPMWSGWRHGWGDWDTFPAFTTVYSGRVMANMQSGDGQRMRCRFYLNDPVEGMEGGGQGQCQLADGHSVDAVFLRA